MSKAKMAVLATVATVVSAAAYFSTPPLPGQVESILEHAPELEYQFTR